MGRRAEVRLIAANNRISFTAENADVTEVNCGIADSLIVLRVLRALGGDNPIFGCGSGVDGIYL